MKTKLLTIFILGIFLFSLASVSALDFDNVMNYDEAKEEIVITNAFNLGADLIKAKLTNNFCDEEGILIEDWQTLRVDDNSWKEQNIRWHKFEYLGEIDDYETRSRSLGIAMKFPSARKKDSPNYLSSRKWKCPIRSIEK